MHGPFILVDAQNQPEAGSSRLFLHLWAGWSSFSPGCCSHPGVEELAELGRSHPGQVQWLQVREQSEKQGWSWCFLIYNPRQNCPFPGPPEEVCHSPCVSGCARQELNFFPSCTLAHPHVAALAGWGPLGSLNPLSLSLSLFAGAL